MTARESVTLADLVAVIALVGLATGVSLVAGLGWALVVVSGLLLALAVLYALRHPPTGGSPT